LSKNQNIFGSEKKIQLFRTDFATDILRKIDKII